MTARERFAELVRGPDVPLGDACFELAVHLGGRRSVAEGRSQLDDLAEAVGEAADVGAVIAALRSDLGFDGDRDRYYDLKNSLLGSVLDRRRGIPITLAIVVIELARRLDVPASGVGMPGHFLVGDGPAPSRWFDPFDGAAALGVVEARARFQGVHGDDAAFDPAFLRPTPPTQIVGRVLNNAAGALRRVGDPRGVLRALELRDEIAGVGGIPRARVELAEAYRSVGRVADAVATLEAVRDQVDPRRRALVDERIARLRAALS